MLDLRDMVPEQVVDLGDTNIAIDADSTDLVVTSGKLAGRKLACCGVSFDEIGCATLIIVHRAG